MGSINQDNPIISSNAAPSAGSQSGDFNKSQINESYCKSVPEKKLTPQATGTAMKTAYININNQKFTVEYSKEGDHTDKLINEVIQLKRDTSGIWGQFRKIFTPKAYHKKMEDMDSKLQDLKERESGIEERESGIEMVPLKSTPRLPPQIVPLEGNRVKPLVSQSKAQLPTESRNEPQVLFSAPSQNTPQVESLSRIQDKAQAQFRIEESRTEPVIKIEADQQENIEANQQETTNSLESRASLASSTSGLSFFSLWSSVASVAKETFETMSLTFRLITHEDPLEAFLGKEDTADFYGANRDASEQASKQEINTSKQKPEDALKTESTLQTTIPVAEDSAQQNLQQPSSEEAAAKIETSEGNQILPKDTPILPVHPSSIKSSPRATSPVLPPDRKTGDVQVLSTEDLSVPNEPEGINPDAVKKALNTESKEHLRAEIARIEVFTKAMTQAIAPFEIPVKKQEELLKKKESLAVSLNFAKRESSRLEERVGALERATSFALELEKASDEKVSRTIEIPLYSDEQFEEINEVRRSAQSPLLPEKFKKSAHLEIARNNASRAAEELIKTQEMVNENAAELEMVSQQVEALKTNDQLNEMNKKLRKWRSALSLRKTVLNPLIETTKIKASSPLSSTGELVPGHEIDKLIEQNPKTLGINIRAGNDEAAFYERIISHPEVDENDLHGEGASIAATANAGEREGGVTPSSMPRRPAIDLTGGSGNTSSPSFFRKPSLKVPELTQKIGDETDPPSNIIEMSKQEIKNKSDDDLKREILDLQTYLIEIETTIKLLKDDIDNEESIAKEEKELTLELKKARSDKSLVENKKKSLESGTPIEWEVSKAIEGQAAITIQIPLYSDQEFGEINTARRKEGLSLLSEKFKRSIHVEFAEEELEEATEALETAKSLVEKNKVELKKIRAQNREGVPFDQFGAFLKPREQIARMCKRAIAERQSVLKSLSQKSESSQQMQSQASISTKPTSPSKRLPEDDLDRLKKSDLNFNVLMRGTSEEFHERIIPQQ